MISATFAADVIPILAPTVALVGVILTLLANAERAERHRRGRLHARALKAAMQYAEMPFAIRRRRHEPENRSAERVRLTTAFSEVQAEIAACQALLDAEHHAEVAGAYRQLIECSRRVAGQLVREAWREDAISADADVNLPHVAEALRPLRGPQQHYISAMKRAARTPLQRFRDWTDLPGA